MDKNSMGEAVLCTLLLFSQLIFPLVQGNTFSDDVALGLESGTIPDSSLTASSMYDDNHGPERARLNIVKVGNLRGGWEPRVSDINQWIQVDLVTPHRIFGLATQGRQDFARWVTSFKIACSVDGVSFDTVQDLSTPGTEKAPSTIPSASYAKILEVCNVGDPSAQFSLTCKPDYRIVVTKGLCVGVVACDGFRESLAESCDGNYTALWGWYCSTRNPCEITCSGTPYCPEEQAYANAEYDCVWAGTETPPTVQETTPALVFNGNSDQNSVVNNTLPVPQVCRYVRLLPLTWQKAISLRMELYGTALVTAILATEMTTPVTTAPATEIKTPVTTAPATEMTTPVTRAPTTEMTTPVTRSPTTEMKTPMSTSPPPISKRSAVYRLVARDRALTDTHSSHPDVTSVIRCGHICFEDRSCKFFTYIKRTGVCLLGQSSTTEIHHEAATYTC